MVERRVFISAVWPPATPRPTSVGVCVGGGGVLTGAEEDGEGACGGMLAGRKGAEGGGSGQEEVDAECEEGEREDGDGEKEEGGEHVLGVTLSIHGRCFRGYRERL